MLEFKFIFLLILIFLSAIGYSFIAPLFPSLAKSKGVDDAYVGMIFSSYSLANVFVIIISNKLLQNFTRRSLLFFSLLSMGIGMVLFGILESIDNQNIFIIISLIVRFVQGISSSLSMILIYSIALSFSDQSFQKKIIAYLEIAYYIGFTFGPLGASFLFHFGGFYLPFMVLGIVMLIATALISKLDIIENENYQNLSLFTILSNWNILSNLITLVILLITNTFFLPFLSEHLQSKYGFSIEMSSFFFVINVISYFLLVPWINEISNFLNLKFSIFNGLMITSISLIMIPPISPLFQHFSIIIIGMLLLGLGSALIQIPCYVNFIDVLKSELNLSEVVANDISSSLFVLGISIGETIGPIVGVYFTQSSSFESSCIWISYICIGYGLVNLTMRYLSERKDQFKKLIDEESTLDQPLIAQSFDEDLNKNDEFNKSFYSFTMRCRARSVDHLGFLRNGKLDQTTIINK